MLGSASNSSPTLVELVIDESELADADDVHVRMPGDGAVLFSEQGQTWELTPWRTEGGHAHAGDGTILSPMPGKIIAVEVSEGQTVTKGQKLLTLEAMKMEHTLVAPFDGTVAELNAVAGAQVQVEAVLARIEVKGDEA